MEPSNVAKAKMQASKPMRRRCHAWLYPVLLLAAVTGIIAGIVGIVMASNLP